MEVQEFKAILESIETGLYQKFEVNLMNPERSALDRYTRFNSVEDYLDFEARDNYIKNAFSWGYSNEGSAFWILFNIEYKQYLLDRYGY
jgi:hypothetical protein